MKSNALNAKSYVVMYGNEQYVASPGQPLVLKVEGKASVRVLQKGAGSDRLLDNVLAIKRGNSVVLKYSDGIEVVLQDYVSECRKEDECVVSLPTKEGGEYGLTGADFDLPSYPDGQLLYAHGDQGTVMQLAGENAQWTEVLSPLDGNEITYLYAEQSQSNAYFIGGLAAGLAAIGGGIAAAGKGGSGGGSASSPSGDTTPPVAPTVVTMITITGITTDTGLSSTDYQTSDQTLEFYGVLSASLKTGEKVQVSLDDGVTWHDAVTVGTNWSYDHTGSPLPNGSYNVIARILDIAGHVGQTVSQVVVVSPDSSQAVSLTSISDDTYSGDDFITSDNTLMFNGSIKSGLESGQKVQVSLDGGGTWHDAVTSGLAWSFDNTDTPLADGSYSVIGRIVNSSGNAINIVEESATVVVDATTPTAISSFTSIYEDSGISATDFVTTNQVLTVSGELSELLPFGQKVQVSLDNGIIWFDVAANGLLWTLDLPKLLEGSYEMQTRVVNPIGTESRWSGHVLTIDITAPSLRIDEATSTMLSGVSEKNSVIKLASNLGGRAEQTIDVGDSGEWQWLSQTKLQEGERLTITSTDLAGNSSVITGQLLDSQFIFMPLSSIVVG